MITKKHIFLKFLLDHEDFVSVCPLFLFKMISSSQYLKFLRKNIYLPSMRYLYRKSLFKNVFDQNFFYFLFVDRFSKVLFHISRQT